MGKWTALKKTLVRFTQPESWQTKIDKVKKEEYGKLTRIDLCKEFKKVDDEKEKLKDLLAAVNTREEALNQLLVEHLEGEAESSVKNEFGTFFIKDDPYSSVTDKEAYNQWIKDEGLEDLLTVNYQTTSGLVKTRLENGQPLPPGITVFMKSSIGHRKATS